MDEGFCVLCGRRVTFPTTRKECPVSPDCGPFRQENAIPDDVLNRTEWGWAPRP